MREHEAIDIINDVTEVCRRGGFHLTSWLTNDSEVLASIPNDERAKVIKDLTFDKLPITRALGVSWNVADDYFTFKFERINEESVTRRSVLSTVSSLYDPLGFCSPFTLQAKILMQDLCRQNLSWNSHLKDDELHRWNKWLTDLPSLHNLKFPRCVVPVDFGSIACAQLHYFSDACELIHAQLLFSKARVTPLKKTTIPRTELTAAMVAVKLHRKFLSEMNMMIDTTTFWTDSMAVLRYIANEKTRFHTFVANRLRVIHEGSTLKQWRFIDSVQNPADIVSRGASVDKLLETKQWFNGPDFLWKPFSSWLSEDSPVLSLPDDDPEVKKSASACQTLAEVIDDHPVEILLKRCSGWMKLKRCLGWILLFCRRMVQKIRAKDQSKVTTRNGLLLEPDILDEAEEIIIRHQQAKYFQDEIDNLEKHKHIANQSSLIKLDPIIGKGGLLRVGGRLSKADLPYNSQHPIILPKKSPISRLLVEKIHKDVGHLGSNTILSQLRHKYWIIAARIIIRSVLFKCVVCRKYRARQTKQFMADLPEDRITPDEPPFTKTGVDYFGPFFVKRGRVSVKRYGVIFTCLVSRAVHIEVAYSLDTDSCICAIRRFIARRGTVKIIYSDNGTNLVGAQRELKEELKRWTREGFQNRLPSITWKFNPPQGSHFGGTWERLIRSVRKILYSMMQQQLRLLDDEGLLTLFTEVEAILNNRPLSYVSSDADDIQVITPNLLLQLRPGESMPCGVFDKKDTYSRRRWKQVQYLADLFWTRWVKDYLPDLQVRQKWHQRKRNLSAGDVVLVVDDSPRNSWTLGRILETYPDKKGIVRVVRVKTPTTVLQRPVHKLCSVLENENLKH